MACEDHNQDNSLRPGLCLFLSSGRSFLNVWRTKGAQSNLRMRGGTFGVLFITPNTKPTLVTTSVPRHSASSLYLTFTTAHSRMHKTRQKDSWWNANTQETSMAEPCCVSDRSGLVVHLDGVWAQAFCLVRLTNVRIHKHTLALCPSCVACNLVILGLWPVKGQLWNTITVCSAVRVSPEWCHIGSYTTANLDATHLSKPKHNSWHVSTKNNSYGCEKFAIKISKSSDMAFPWLLM